MNKIEKISKSKTIDYGAEAINNFWLCKNKNTDNQENNSLRKIISVFEAVQDSIICVQTEQIDSSKLIEAIFNASKKRNRIYILTNNKPEKLKELTGSCLIRYGIKNIGSFILVNPNSSSAKGIIYTAPFLETSFANENTDLELDNNQTKILFRFFCDNFWNKATNEIIDNFNTPQTTSEPPLDFLPNMDDFCDAVFIKNKINKIKADANILVPNIQNSNVINFDLLENSNILTSLTDDDLLLKLANNNNLYANENITPRVIINKNGKSYLIPKTHISEEDNFYAIELNSKQIEKLDNEFEQQISKSEFKFHLSEKRENLIDKEIKLISDIDNTITINSDVNKKVEDIQCDKFLPKEAFGNQEPRFIDDNISCKINYNWEIIPFYVPKNAKKARLYTDWENKEKAYDDFLDNIDKAIQESSESKKVGERLKRFFLGKKQKISGHTNELENLKTKKLSELDKSEKKEVVEKVNELAQKVNADLSEINTEIKKAEIDEEIERLEKEKDEQQLELEIFIEEEDIKLKKKEDEKEEKLKVFCEKYKKEEKDLPKFRSELEQKSGKKHRKKNPEEAKKAETTLLELNQITNSFNFRKKFEDEKKKKEKSIQKIDNEIERKQKEKSKISATNDKQEDSSLSNLKGKQKKSNKNNSKFEISEKLLKLPTKGELYERGNKKYLAIEYWEEYEEAKQEAKRLNSELCVEQ